MPWFFCFVPRLPLARSTRLEEHGSMEKYLEICFEQTVPGSCLRGSSSEVSKF